MKKSYLIFQSTADIADFLIKRKITNALVDSREISLTAIMNADDIEIAQRVYHAQLVLPHILQECV